MRTQPVVQETLHQQGDKVVLGEGMLKGLEAIYMQPDGELRAMVLVELLSKPHLISYEVASLLPQT